MGYGSIDALEAAGAKVPATPPHNNIKQLPAHITYRPYQQEGIRALYEILQRHSGALLADDMGLGKTVQGATVASLLSQDTLVVCPATVRHQWVNWFTAIGQPSVELGPPSDKRQQPAWARWQGRSATVAAVSYQLMSKALAQRIPTMLVFDEPHNFLTGRANTYVKALWKYGGGVQYKLGITGTPYLSKPAGLWQLLNILLGQRFGRAREFDERYCGGHQGQWGWVNNGATNTGELRQRLSHYQVRRMKAEVAQDLPKVTRTVRWVDSDPRATAALATSSTSLTGLRGAVQATLESKMDEVVEVAKQTSTPFVVFTWQRKDADTIGQLLLKNKIENVVIHGEQNAQQRANTVAMAHAQKLNVVTTYGATGQGLDGLQKWISNAIYHAIDPSPAILLQASARLDRIGQTQPVNETYLAMRDSIDELTVDKVINRMDTWTSIMGKDKSSTEVRQTLAGFGMDNGLLDSIFEEMSQ